MEKNHTDIALGVVGTIGTLTLTEVNVWLAFVAGVFTVGFTAIRFIKEWRNRDK